MKQLRILPTLFTKYLIQFVYSLTSLFFRIDQNKVTIATYRSSNLEGNLAFIKEEIDESYPNIKCVVLAKKFNSSLAGKIEYAIHLVTASYHMATSRFFIIDDFYFPVYVVHPREGTEIVQVWHAAGAFKKFGLSTIGKSFGPSSDYLKHVNIHGNYSRVYVSSKEVIPHYADAFGMDESRIYPLGVPRTDYFFDGQKLDCVKEKFYRIYPELKSRKVILYAPTFRGKSHYQGIFDIPIDMRLMKKHLSDEFALLVHLHPYMTNGARIDDDLKGFVYHIHNDFSIEELLLLSDILITDYSSIIFDYSILKRPIAFFVHDLEAYLEERDFYYAFESFVPGPIFYESEALIKWLNDEPKNLEEIQSFRGRFFDQLDGNASKRIVKDLLG